ncbi:MAG: immunity 8 family protein [Bryobacteraceae bacterium]
MIRAKIKTVEITEVLDLDPAKFNPDDLQDFRCTFGLKIGPANDDGEELFYLSVCSPKWLARACEKDGFVWGRHHLVVPEYNLSAIMEIITKLVEVCSGGSWQEVTAKLGGVAAWEFEDYQS